MIGDAPRLPSVGFVFLLSLSSGVAVAETPDEIRLAAEAFLRPYAGPAAESDSPVVDRTTLTGKVMLKIPPLTQNGRVFKLGGLGMPRLGASGRGDLYAKVRVQLPQQLDDEQRRLFEELRAAGA